jgi:hypothetical protein
MGAKIGKVVEKWIGVMEKQMCKYANVKMCKCANVKM